VGSSRFEWFATVWLWISMTGEEIGFSNVITSEANQVVVPIPGRMPLL
jgi:hypothetical protein